jgi:hypothetical protein
LKQGVIYFIKQALPPNISAGSVRKIVKGQNHPVSSYWPIYASLDSVKLASFTKNIGLKIKIYGGDF